MTGFLRLMQKRLAENAASPTHLLSFIALLRLCATGPPGQRALVAQLPLLSMTLMQGLQEPQLRRTCLQVLPQFVSITAPLSKLLLRLAIQLLASSSQIACETVLCQFAMSWLLVDLSLT